MTDLVYFSLTRHVDGVDKMLINCVNCVVLKLLQAATYYCVRLGFKEVGYKGLETGSRQIAAHVVRQNKARHVLIHCYL